MRVRGVDEDAGRLVDPTCRAHSADRPETQSTPSPCRLAQKYDLIHTARAGALLSPRMKESRPVAFLAAEAEIRSHRRVVHVRRFEADRDHPGGAGEFTAAAAATRRDVGAGAPAQLKGDTFTGG